MEAPNQFQTSCSVSTKSSVKTISNVITLEAILKT